jgi:indole-3-glycerol phosphate synthase/phosphoribosylanthranilate isomerase
MIDPGGVLGEIVARKKADVAARLSGIALDDLRARAAPTRISLAAALAQPGARFIMEVKRVSPSNGPLRAEADPAAIARGYRGAADAISVLTDGPYFGGSLEDLAAVRREFGGPVLAKDFVVDTRQVVEARIHGADAVLAMLSVLEDEEAAAVIAEARRLGMDVLVEAHSEAEVRRAVALGARIVGINNRDLKTLKVDLAVTERLAGLIPDGRLVVAESGIGDRSDVERLAPFADAFLVGSSLMRAPRPDLAARALAFGRVKLCGLTDPNDAALAAASGASFAGVIMVPNTPRAVSRAQAEAVAAAAGLPAVGVFRNQKPAEVADAARTLGLHAVQLHGEEDAGYIRALRALLPEETEVWGVAAIGRDLPEPRLGADRTLFDTKVNGRSGGTGLPFDWARIRDRGDLAAGILAGGLKPGNAAEAARVGAYGLDVSSGVETLPGRKDEEKVQAFFAALRVPVRGETAPC